MKDAMGGTVVITIIVFFIALVSGYLAYNVNYMKAFKMKDRIIAVYSKYNGNCSTQCQNEISTYAREIGYDLSPSFTCPSGYTRNTVSDYCFKSVCLVGNESSCNVYCSDVNSTTCIQKNAGGGTQNVQNEHQNETYYKIITKINVNIPIINNIFNFDVFNVTGDTKIFRENN